MVSKMYWAILKLGCRTKLFRRWLLKPAGLGKRDNFPHRHLLTQPNKKSVYTYIAEGFVYCRYDSGNIFLRKCFDQTKGVVLFFPDLSNEKIYSIIRCINAFVISYL